MIFKKNKFKKSYSQSGEDLIVSNLVESLKLESISYLDIGAYHPYKFSNTALFYENGLRGINIEPDPTLFVKINKARKKDINLNFGIAEKNGTLDFYIINVPTLNTFSKKVAESYKHEGNYTIKKTIKIPVETLDFVLDTYCNGKFPEFLSLDAEGLDWTIIKSINYKKHYPLIICVETLSFSTSVNDRKNHSIIEHLINNGYVVYADTYINTIFVRKNIYKSIK